MVGCGVTYGDHRDIELSHPLYRAVPDLSAQTVYVRDKTPLVSSGYLEYALWLLERSVGRSVSQSVGRSTGRWLDLIWDEAKLDWSFG